jgi:hypothetical protein
MAKKLKVTVPDTDTVTETLTVTNTNNTISADQIAQAKQLVTSITNPVVSGAQVITVTDNVSYEYASLYLSQVLQAKKRIESETDDNLLFRLIKPLRTALDTLYEIRRNALKPLEQAEKLIKQKMSQYKLLEFQRLEAERVAKEAEERRLRQEAERLAREAIEAEARANKLRNATQAETKREEANKLSYQAEVSARIADMVKSQPVTTPIKVTTSAAKFTKRWRLRDNQNSLESFIKRVAKGDAPSDMVMLDSKKIDEYFSDLDYRAVIADWPEFEIYDDDNIAGRS